MLFPNNLELIWERENIDILKFAESTNLSREILADAIFEEVPAPHTTAEIVLSLRKMTGKKYMALDVFPLGSSIAMIADPEGVWA